MGLAGEGWNHKLETVGERRWLAKLPHLNVAFLQTAHRHIPRTTQSKYRPLAWLTDFNDIIFVSIGESMWTAVQVFTRKWRWADLCWIMQTWIRIARFTWGLLKRSELKWSSQVAFTDNICKYLRWNKRKFKGSCHKKRPSFALFTDEHRPLPLHFRSLDCLQFILPINFPYARLRRHVQFVHQFAQK